VIFSDPNLNSPYVIPVAWRLLMLHSPSTLNISLTEKAAQKVKVAMDKQGRKDVALRLYVSGGGCSGFQYGLAFDNQTDGDHVIEAHGVKLLVDEQSAQYLDGSEVDYVETVMGEGFRVNNPNATETCGCGHSFKPK
jgi:iron-sulfur cluster assembly protein